MNGYDLLKIVLNWAGAPLTAEDIKKHRCVRQSANSITGHNPSTESQDTQSALGNST